MKIMIREIEGDPINKGRMKTSDLRDDGLKRKGPFLGNEGIK